MTKEYVTYGFMLVMDMFYQLQKLEHTNPQYLAQLQKIGLKIDYSHFDNDKKVAFAFPSDLNEEEVLIKKLVGSHDKMRSNKKYLANFDLKTIILLLVNSMFHQKIKVENPISTFKLVILYEKEEAELYELFNSLDSHASDLRVYVKKTKNGIFGVFRVHDNIQLYSMFTGLQASGKLNKHIILHGFEFNDKRIYLPKSQAPSVAALKIVIRLCEKQPDFFKLSLSDKTKDLFAIYKIPTKKNSVDVISLKGKYLSRFELWPDSVNFHPLENENKDSLKLTHDLRHNLENKNLGYRLFLQQTNTVDTKKGTIEDNIYRIENEIIALQEQEEELRTQFREKKRKKLLRFSQQKLPFLVEALIALEPSQLKEVKYYFHGVSSSIKKADVLGYHYLLIDLDKLPNYNDYLNFDWSAGDIEETTFILDPYWNIAKTNHLVFVPSGYQLSPPWINWKDETKEHYLQETILNHWFKTKNDPIEKAIYLFEHTTEDNEKAWTLRILDRSKFKAMKDFTIGWINKNLTLLDTHEKIVPLLEKIITCQSTIEQKKFIRQQQKTAKDEYQEEIKKLKNVLQEQSNEIDTLENKFVAELNTTIINIEKSINELDKMNSSLNNLKAELQTTNSNITNLRESTYTNIIKTNQKFISDSADKIKNLRKGLITTFEKTISDIKNERQKIRNKY